MRPDRVPNWRPPDYYYTVERSEAGECWHVLQRRRSESEYCYLVVAIAEARWMAEDIRRLFNLYEKKLKARRGK